MDVRIEATPMVAEALVANVVIYVLALVHKVVALVKRTASFVCLSIGGTSLSAVAPDHIFEGGTA